MAYDGKISTLQAERMQSILSWGCIGVLNALSSVGELSHADLEEKVGGDILGITRRLYSHDLIEVLGKSADYPIVGYIITPLGVVVLQRIEALHHALFA